MTITQLAFIGGGNIAQAIVGGLVESGYDRGAITISDPSPVQGAKAEAMGVNWSQNNAAAINVSDLVFICVKPNLVETVCREATEQLASKTLISVAAGITTQQLIKWSGSSEIVRCMPNTPALVSQGMTGLFATATVAMTTRDSVGELLSTIGKVAWFDAESDLDAVTAISGSGPAYFFYLMEAMVEAAESFNINREVAQTLVLQTALGAATMAQNHDSAPKALRAQVTSPGGTTEAACHLLEAAGLSDTIQAACKAALDRSISLSNDQSA